MDFEDLNKRYKNLAEKLQQATSGDPMLSILITAMMTLYESLSGMFAEQKTTVQKLTAVIERLEAKLGYKSITVSKKQHAHFR